MHPLIEEFLRVSGGECLESHFRDTLEDRLLEIPWCGAHPAWHEMPNTQSFDWGRASNTEAADFLKSLSVSDNKQLCTFYGLKYPVFKLNRDWLIENLDVAALNTQQYFIFGYDGLILLEQFIEVDPGRKISGWPR